MQEEQPLVLVVDDEPLIVMNVVDMLEDFGYRAIEAFDAARALEALQEHHDVALVFTDIDMPGRMNGLGLAALVDEKWPHIDILISSGRKIPSASDMPPKARFLTKPYSSQHLVLALRELGLPS
jgi:two-component system, response regulator PdtaR